MQHLSGTDRADAINAVRQTVLAAMAGATVFAGLAYTARTYLLSRRGQVTDRYRAAVENLASEKLEVRLGAVYSLEHVLSESAVDHEAIVRVLAGFVRHNTHRGTTGIPPTLPEQRNALETEPDRSSPELSADIQAAVEVLARRPKRPETRRLDLRHADLARLSLRHFEFESPPRLEWMFLSAADLRSADLRGVVLKGSILSTADMCFAWLSDARCDRAVMYKVDLRGAMLGKATFVETTLDGADLRETSGLTAQQLASAFIDAETRLPDHLVHDPWVATRLADCVAWAEGNHTKSCPPPTPQPQLPTSAST
ncbi:pentapeptide repeat-containing protein [Streptomyces sp. NPDC058466]|uniref:pentapeptide repeat-containing protein n=1 Tax=Streptomyces sp. NPDC058466 TaxID=3346512 RepID=UPI00365E81B7